MGVLVVFQDETKLSQHELGPDPIVIGRDASCTICLDSPTVNPRHAVFLEKNGMAGIKSLGTPGETLHNGEILDRPHQLQAGDEVLIGAYRIEYHRKPPSDAVSLKPPSDAVSLKPPSAVQEPKVPPAPPAAAETTEFSDDEDGDDDFGDEDEEIHGADEGTAVRDDTLTVGEFEAPDTSDDLEVVGTADQCEPLPVPDALQALIKERFQYLDRLDELEAQRQKLLNDETLPEAAAMELRRQSRELQNLPTAEKAQASMEKRLEKRAALEEKLRQQEEAPPPDTADDLEEEAEAPPKKLVPPSPRLVQAQDMGIQQWQIVIDRDAMAPRIVAAALPLAAKEPLYGVARTFGIDVDRLFGWAIYSLAVEAKGSQINEMRKTLRAKMTEMDNKSSGIFGKLRGKDKDAEQDFARLQAEERRCAALFSHVQQENKSLEPELIRLFWDAYQLFACLLVSGKAPEEDALAVRAYLRYGLLGHERWFLPPATLEHLLTQCRDVVREWNYSTDANHVLYADEYLFFVARGFVTPSIDENLELNQRNSDAWKADKAWRRVIMSTVKETALREMAATLRQRVGEIQEERTQLEERKGKLVRGAKDAKKKAAALSQKIQGCRVKAARFNRAVERIDEVYLPREQDHRQTAQQRLADSGAAPTPLSLIKREVAGLHRVCRLTANLRDRFAPFALRENYRPDPDLSNERPTMLAQVEDIEKRDPLIFKDPLMPVKKKAHRLYLRYSPLFLLVPACGFIGYSWNPRAGAEIGRLVFPLYCPRQRLRERMLHNLFADFRWDTSKASAGVDLLTSDTLVAAYATVRWEYRKRSREIREKSALYNEETDRKNWRRHYELYMASAFDAGKKLFFKCFDMYERVILKYMDLPDGVERLKR